MKKQRSVHAHGSGLFDINVVVELGGGVAKGWPVLLHSGDVTTDCTRKTERSALVKGPKQPLAVILQACQKQ